MLHWYFAYKQSQWNCKSNDHLRDSRGYIKIAILRGFFMQVWTDTFWTCLTVHVIEHGIKTRSLNSLIVLCLLSVRHVQKILKPHITYNNQSKWKMKYTYRATKAMILYKMLRFTKLIEIDWTIFYGQLKESTIKTYLYRINPTWRSLGMLIKWKSIR